MGIQVNITDSDGKLLFPFLSVCLSVCVKYVHVLFDILISFFLHRSYGSLRLVVWAKWRIDRVFIVSVYTVTAHWWPFRILRLWMRCSWTRLRDGGREKPGSNVCRCILNWGIAFLVIAISIWALLSLLSHFRLALISLSLFSLSRSLSRSHTFSFCIVSLSCFWLCGWSTNFKATCEQLADKKEYIPIISAALCWGRSDINMPNHVQMLTDLKHY